MLFAENKWRVFYHSHDKEEGCTTEYGHFHLFVDVGNQDWAHVAGLSIDCEGQPQDWFMTNRWVTDGSWLSKEDFIARLKELVISADDDIVGNWLTVLLHLYSDTLCDMIEKRDLMIEKKMNRRSLEETLNDRDCYTLGRKSIDLQSMLEKYLIHSHAKTA